MCPILVKLGAYHNFKSPVQQHIAKLRDAKLEAFPLRLKPNLMLLDGVFEWLPGSLKRHRGQLDVQIKFVSRGFTIAKYIIRIPHYQMKGVAAAAAASRQ